MIILQGKSVYGAVKSGTITVYKRCRLHVTKKFTTDTDGELLRFESAKNSALAEIRALYERTLSEIGEENADIFTIHMALLRDPDYNAAVNGIIRQERVNAEYAVAATAHELAKKFSRIKQDYMKERYADVADVSDRILRFLVSGSEEKLPSSQNVILYADELVPSEILEIDRTKINAFITEFGSTASHAAILARNMGLPAVVGTGTLDEDKINGHFAIVDGFSGTVYIDPDEPTMAAMQRKKMPKPKKKHSSVRFPARKILRFAAKKLNCLPTFAARRKSHKCWKTTAAASGCSAASFCIFNTMVIRTKKPNLPHTAVCWML